uniref:Conotoxin Cal6.36 n=1 Tax=Californiconus californicus TaxID=1736779 RepID=C636_CONCL|nr:RecName: Full=Conotoxin Cal6.36; AltName: Full=O1_cal6.36; Flags: Precursor [Californiconus californicus]
MKVTCVLTLAVLILTVGQMVTADCRSPGSWCFYKHSNCCSGNCFLWCVQNGK